MFLYRSLQHAKHHIYAAGSLLEQDWNGFQNVELLLGWAAAGNIVRPLESSANLVIAQKLNVTRVG